MFKTTPDATFIKTVYIPNGDESLPLKLRFKRKNKPDLGAWTEAAKIKPDTESLGEVIDGWIDVDKPYSTDELTSLLLAYPGAGLAIYLGYLNGHMQAERKN